MGLAKEQGKHALLGARKKRVRNAMARYRIDP
jgi:hypothetical protein